MDPVWLEWFHREGAELANRRRRLDLILDDDEEEEDRVALALAPYVDRHYNDPVYYRLISPRTRPRSPSPSSHAGDDDNKRACILGLKEVVPTAKNDDNCAICLNPLADIVGPDPDHKKDDATATSMLRAMPCSHIFHQHCILQWLHRNAVCPLCRYQLPTTFKDEDTEEEDEDEDEDEEEEEEEEEEETNNSNSRLNQIRRRLQILYN
ncbi:F-actin-monooxygenase MICAL3 [Zea mays]|jgi:hypothetical protein|nr:F-actin-monooxygenase MICAL3 [Zea mays]|eukprot:XP_008669849.1 F-actin-monooxygenase MICAL3 [Zea mays]